MPATDRFAERATLARSVRLLAAFRFEQSDPDRFYGALADDTVAMVGDLWRSVSGTEPVGADAAGRRRRARLLRDRVHRGRRALRRRRTRSARDARRRAAHRVPRPARSCGRRGRRCRSPTTASTSACRRTSPSTSREPWRLGDEMLRVTRPGGLVVLSYTVWLGPFGGHEMGLTHYLGGYRAAERYTRKHGHRPKNDYGSSLFAVSARRRPAVGRGHRRAGRRIPALPPAMGLVADPGAGSAGIPGEQSGAGVAAVLTPDLQQVLVWPHDR